VLPGSGARICSKCGVTRVTGVTIISNVLYSLGFIGLHRSDTPIFKRVTASSRVTVADECRVLQRIDRTLAMVSRR
jgi:hypothetical protein